MGNCGGIYINIFMKICNWIKLNNSIKQCNQHINLKI